ncbi:MAG: hypothetical protein MI747_03830 [Desulfobacterales bacterium]|nr:hypothetical protein [Desulfobacterales bacterium]
MTLSPYKTIELENGHTLVIKDLSRRIAADAQVVIMEASMEIPIVEDLFRETPVSGEELEDIRKVLGDHIAYTYKVERNMIMDPDKDGVLENLVATFLKNTGQYVQNPKFPEKLVLKEYRERVEKQNKYKAAAL